MTPNIKYMLKTLLHQKTSSIRVGCVLLMGIFLLHVVGCQSSSKNLPKPIETYTPQYASGFKIYYYDHCKILEVAGQYRYCLISNSTEENKATALPDFPTIPIIETPVKRMACMSHSHWAAVDLFEQTNTILGICDPEYLNDSSIMQRINNKTLQNIATNQTIYMEALFSLQPQMIMVSFFDAPIYKKIEEQNIAVVRNGDFLENHPLGRAEWMIFTASFFNEEEAAIARFDTICQKYNHLKKQVLETHSRPTVFDGSEYNGIWYVSGGKSYMAKFYEDAGADYIWKENDHTASLPLDLEVVYQQGINADFWRLYLNNHETYAQLIEKNHHYADFKALKSRKIIYCNNLQCDLFGAGVFQPDIVLTDFVQAFHPEIIKDRQAVYYKILTD